MRTILGTFGLGYAQAEVSVLTDPEERSAIGPGACYLNAQGPDGAKVALWLNGKEVDKLILLLRDAKRMLLEAGDR